MKQDKGFALLIAVVTTSILLLVSFVVANLASRQVTISSADKESQFAFYAADSGVECAVYWDSKNGSVSSFDPSATNAISCNRQNISVIHTTNSSGHPLSTFSIPNLTAGCADVTVEKIPAGNPSTIIRSHGYNTCDSTVPRRYERGVTVSY